MRVFRPVVESFVLPMLNPWQDFAFGRPITSEFIRDNHSRHVLQLFEQLAEKFLGGLFIATALHKDIEHITLLIDGSPEEVLLPTNREDYLVHMPLVATTWATATQFIGVGLSEFE